MNRKYHGDIRIRFDTDTDITIAEKIRRGIRFSPSKPPIAEILEYENLRDEVLAARISRAAKTKRKMP